MPVISAIASFTCKEKCKENPEKFAIKSGICEIRDMKSYLK